MASGNMYAEFRVEAAPNAESAPNSVGTPSFRFPIQGIALNPSPISDDRTDEFRGTAQPVIPDRTGQNPTTGQVQDRLYPNDIGMFLFAALGPPTSTAGDGSSVLEPSGGTVGVGATKHVWDSGTQDFSLIRTLQVYRSYGNSTNDFFLDRGVTVSQLDLAVGDFGQPSTFAASVTGLYQSRVSDPGLSATVGTLSIPPFYRSNFTVPTWLSNTTAGSLGIGASFSFTNPVEPSPGFAASLWPTGWERPNTAGAVPMLTGTLDAKTIGTADYDAFMASSSFGYMARWRNTTNAGTSTTPYGLWIQGCASYQSYDQEELVHNLRTGAQIGFTAGATGGTSAYTVTLVNATPSYSSVG